MLKVLALSVLSVSLVMAADLVLTTAERAAARTLLSQVFPAEIQVKSGCFQDMDGNQVGEYLFLTQLAGRATTSHLMLRNGDSGIHMLTGPLATSLISGGYQFAVVLPGGAKGLVVEADPMPVVQAAGVADRERFFAAITWPVAKLPGGHAFLVMQDGVIRFADNDGTSPEASKAIAYDAGTGTWTSSWQAIPQTELTKLQSAEPAAPAAGF